MIQTILFLPALLVYSICSAIMAILQTIAEHQDRVAHMGKWQD